MRTPATLLLAVLACPLGASDLGDAPRLEVRATPRIANRPAWVMVTAVLEGGDELEEYYCPGVEFDWGDGSLSARESDCDPWHDGATLQRRFTGRHVFRWAGVHTIRVRLVRAGRTVATASARVRVQGPESF